MRVFFGNIALALTMGVGGGPPDAAHAADSFSPATSSYATSRLAARTEIAAAASGPAAFTGYSGYEEDTAPETQSYWPVLYSALLPGTGELSMGYEKRGIALMVAEVVAWSGYYVNHSDGMDQRDAYESFADAHWDFDKWIADHPTSCPHTTLEELEKCGQDSSDSGAWPGWIPYISKEEDKQHYYENLGKYDWYISGWSDWDPAQNPYARATDLRTQYRSMRAESNNSLDDATAFVWLSVVARAFSIAETAIIVHNRRADAGGGHVSPVSLRARARGTTGGEVALEVRFK